jgi:hypothetical protein
VRPWILLALAACSDPNIATCAIACEPAIGCPDGFECSNGRCAESGSTCPQTCNATDISVGCKRPMPQQPPDLLEPYVSLLPYDPTHHVLTWTFAVPAGGMHIGNVGITIRNPGTTPGTIAAAIVYQDNTTSPVTQMMNGDVLASTLIDVPASSGITTVTATWSVDLDQNIGDPNAPRSGFPHAIVFSTGVLGATLPQFDVAMWTLGDCTDPNAPAGHTDWPQDDNSLPLENGPELFLNGVDRCP